MRYIYFLILILMCVLHSCKKDNISSWDYYNLEGKVKTVTVIETDAILKNTGWEKRRDDYYIETAQELQFSEEGLLMSGKTYVNKEFVGGFEMQYSDGYVEKYFTNDQNKKTRKDDIKIDDELFKVLSYESYDLEVNQRYYFTELSWTDNKRIDKEIGKTLDTNHVSYESDYYYSDGVLESEILTWIYVNQPSSQTKYTYDYYVFDKQGNWISRVKNLVGSEYNTKIEERVIIYY